MEIFLDLILLKHLVIISFLNKIQKNIGTIYKMIRLTYSLVIYREKKYRFENYEKFLLENSLLVSTRFIRMNIENIF